MFDRGFTIVSNAILDNFGLSKDARLLIIYLTRYATCPNFVAYASTKMKWLDCGRDKLKAVHKELKDHGYIRHVVIRGKGGRVSGSYIEFHVEPIFKNDPIPIDDHPEYMAFHRETENQSPGHQAPGKTSLILNTDLLTNTDLKQTTTPARASDSLNTKEIDQAKVFVAVLKEGEMKKVCNGEFTYEYYDDELTTALGAIDISNARANALIVKHGRERIKEVIEMTKKNAKRNPIAYFNQALAHDWKPSKVMPVKDDVDHVARAKKMVVEEQKRKEEWDRGQKVKEALKSNPEALKSRMSELREALRLKMNA
jgi:hypothetical protein